MMGGGVDFSPIRALTRALASCKSFDFGEVLATAADPLGFDVDPLFHGDLEIGGAVNVRDVPLRWRVIVSDGLLMDGEGFLQALNVASKCGLVARCFFFPLRDGGAKPGDEFSESVLGDVVEGQERVDHGARGDGISRLYGCCVVGGTSDSWHVVRGTRGGSRFVSDRGIHVEEALQ
jgi:hypothetical protein